MLWRRIIFCLPVLCFTGCTWIPYTIDNVDKSVGDIFHEARFKREAWRLAEMAWQEVACDSVCHGKTSELEKGFKEGFFDYLDCNGNTQPPAAPPRRLLNHRIRTAAEEQAIHDWFEGFRLGASTAAQTRWRERIVVPLSLPSYVTEPTYGEEIIPKGGAIGTTANRVGPTMPVASGPDSGNRGTSNANAGGVNGTNLRRTNAEGPVYGTAIFDQGGAPTRDSGARDIAIFDDPPP